MSGRKTHRRSLPQALAEGFEIDHSAAGRPVGYKGPRSQPIEWCDCLTELESALLALCEELLPYAEHESQDTPAMHALIARAKGGA